ncbi:hypothetical protein DM02DRAFT_632840 [Periconia macrospinosa]|uniref:Tat pathway signal sequence n=1 Tax=Periconia macrospinosa TaxID=97972 RepID=A0A2V1DE88_9PLEO|nr:hypothetical protein DM02DRAFT_632840 [Periconia macrospinosa]
MDQKRPLLEEDDDFVYHNSGTQRWKRITIALLAVYNVLVSVALAVVVLSKTSPTEGSTLTPPPSIIQKELAHELQSVQAHPGSTFSGPPSPEHDEAWSELLRPLFVNVSASELMRVNVDPINQLRLFDGGYIASLETYHHLHCIRRLKWHLYESYYFANITDAARTLELNHMNHCIESLRLATMCHADTSLYTLKWRGEGKRPEPINHGQRKCTIWNEIEQWAMPRAVSNNPKLVNPDKLVVSSTTAEETGMPRH